MTSTAGSCTCHMPRSSIVRMKNVYTYGIPILWQTTKGFGPVFRAEIRLKTKIRCKHWYKIFLPLSHKVGGFKGKISFSWFIHIHHMHCVSWRGWCSLQITGQVQMCVGLTGCSVPPLKFCMCRHWSRWQTRWEVQQYCCHRSHIRWPSPPHRHAHRKSLDPPLLPSTRTLKCN